MTYDRILSHKLYKSNYFKSTLQKCLQQEGVAGLGTLSLHSGHGVDVSWPYCSARKASVTWSIERGANLSDRRMATAAPSVAPTASPTVATPAPTTRGGLTDFAIAGMVVLILLLLAVITYVTIKQLTGRHGPGINPRWKGAVEGQNPRWRGPVVKQEEVIIDLPVVRRPKPLRSPEIEDASFIDCEEISNDHDAGSIVLTSMVAAQPNLALPGRNPRWTPVVAEPIIRRSASFRARDLKQMEERSRSRSRAKMHSTHRRNQHEFVNQRMEDC